MSDLRKAAQAVLSAWDDPAGTTGVCRALDDLRAALATVPSDCRYSHQPQREPLTDEEIHDCFQQRSRDKTKERRLITRAIERAHGIGGKYER